MRKDLLDTGVPQHIGKEQFPPLFQGTQWPLSDSTLYLPDSRRAWVVAFSTSQGEDPQELKMAWHLVRPKNLVLRYCKEWRMSAWALNFSNQNWITAALTIDFTWSLEGWVESHLAGWGSPYWRERSLSLQNQDFEEGFADGKILEACLARMLSPSLNLHSWPNSVNILMCSWAGGPFKTFRNY